MESKDKKKLSVETIGCRLNQYESERMATSILPYGFTRAGRGEAADLYVINTCTVTHKADSDARKMIRRAARQNPGSKIVVSGCYVDNDPELIAGMEGVDLIIRNSEKDDIANILSRELGDLFWSEPDKGCTGNIEEFYRHNRAWVKVSDGCNQWCSFCIIPSVRGRLRNRRPREIIEEINGLVGAGYQEVVLTGVHLGHYKYRKSEPHIKNLAALCKMIMNETDLYRLRISSIEPQTVRDDLIDLYAQSNGRICRHFHLPLQSGSSAILWNMRRPYDQACYVNRLKAIRDAVPKTTIGADVIVGFPGETDEDFNRTKHLSESGLIDYLHVFSYSDRPGTPASEMKDKVPHETIKERNAILTRLSMRLRYEAHKRQIGETLHVISEDKIQVGGYYLGVADNYIKVKLPAEIQRGKKSIRVHVTDANQSFVEGKVVD